RPGGYTATGGHGGVVGSIRGPAGPVLTFRPLRRFTYCSEVNLSRIPTRVSGVRVKDGLLDQTQVQIKDERGNLVADAMPRVTLAKTARYLPPEDGVVPGG